MNNKQFTCQPIQAAKSLPDGKPVVVFGRMECRSLGDGRMATYARIGGMEPPEVKK